MHDAAVQVNLIGLLSLGEDLLGAVALLGWEDGVCFGGGDGERALDGAEFVFFDEAGGLLLDWWVDTWVVWRDKGGGREGGSRWMGDESDRDSFSASHEPDHIFGTLEDISYSLEISLYSWLCLGLTKQYPTAPIFLYPFS